MRDNIAQFGGDPGNVTIFGQSGGGGKTAMLTAMPAAKGLFHRAIIMSTLADTAITGLEPRRAVEAAELLLSRLGIRPADAARAAAAAGRADRRRTHRWRRAPAARPDRPHRPATSRCGTCRWWTAARCRAIRSSPTRPQLGDGSDDVRVERKRGNPVRQSRRSLTGRRSPTDAQALRERVKRIVRVDDAEADRLIALYRTNRPRDSYGDLAAVMAGDNSPLRLSSYAIAERKFAQGKAPVYMYYFPWRSPVRNGKLRSMHCMETAVRLRPPGRRRRS